MKHFMRKPMLPALLLAVMVFGTGFLAFFRGDIAAGWDRVERMYRESRITVEVVPDSGWGNLQLKTHKNLLIEAMPEVAETLSVMECYYVLRDGTPLPEPTVQEENNWYSSVFDGQWAELDTAKLRGTNNLPWLTEHWDLDVQWQEGRSEGDFRVTEGVVPCLATRAFLEEQGLAPGDVIDISPSPKSGAVALTAPTFSLRVVGTYEEALGHTEEGDLLVPEESFLGQPRIFYNSDMMYRCYYRAYAVALAPEFNRDYDRIEQALEDILYDIEGYSFVSNARALEQAARPLMQKLQMQELLVLPLCVLLCCAAVVLAVLLGLSMETEVFLRLMWGEKRLAVLGRLMGAVCLWLLVCLLAASVAGGLTAGSQWLGWAAKYSAVTAALSALGCGVPLARACGSNLVKFYQSREGE